MMGRRSGGCIRSAMVVLVAGFSLGGQPTAAAASPHHPTGYYERFSDCPLTAPVLEDCLFAAVDGGVVSIGRRTLSVERQIVIQGGFYEGPNEEYLVFVGADDGATLVAPALNVPGGITGLMSPGYLPTPLQAQLSHSATGVTATLQLAKPASVIQVSTENFLSGSGTALQLPVKIKLSNQFLGENCYIGSSSNPVLLNMTTGITSPSLPNRSIKGTVGVVEEKESYQWIQVRGSELVDNSFAVPQATGCGGVNASIVDSALDAGLGLPSLGGHNTAIFYGPLSLATPTAVRRSE